METPCTQPRVWCLSNSDVYMPGVLERPEGKELGFEDKEMALFATEPGLDPMGVLKMMGLGGL